VRARLEKIADPLGLLYGLLSHARSGGGSDDARWLSQTLTRESGFLSAVFDNMAEGVIMADECGRVALWNRAAQSILRMPAPELCNMQWLAQGDPQRPDDEPLPLPATDSPVARALRGQTVDDMHVMVRHDALPKGVWISVNARPLPAGRNKARGAVVVLRDVTAERAARLAAERAQRDVRRVIENSPVGIAVVREERWIFVNHAMAQALGYAEPAQLIGRTRSEVMHPEDCARIAAHMTAAVNGDGRKPADYEVRYLRADGEYAVMESSLAALAEFEGAPALLVMARNVTERKKLQAQLQVSERLVSVGTLAAGVAHEINSPLAALLGHLEWLSARLERRLCEESPDGEFAAAAHARAVESLFELAEPVREAKDAAERVRLIVRDLKIFSRAEEELRGPVDLTRVLDSAARLAWNEVRHRGRLIKDYRLLPPAFGNEARLGQVVLNLLINAAQAIPEGQADRHEIRLSARATANARVVIEVRDTGVGIAPEVQARIFDPFFTTKPPGVGTGLGLSICHRIVADYGGQLDVESEPGKGSLFRVTLSIAHGAAARAAAPLAATRPSRRGRILVLDDDAAIGATLKLILSEWHQVTALTSPREALRVLRSGQSYDVVLCDVMMPEMTAMDFHAELAAHLPEAAAKVVFLTGGAFTVTAREFLDRVPNVRFEKPFDLRSLVALVNERIAQNGRAEAALATPA
jgi:PAS domain S-box-containing protein